MPKINVEIKWDEPKDSFWLNADNIAVALSAYCRNTNFIVTELKCENISKVKYAQDGLSD